MLEMLRFSKVNGGKEDGAAEAPLTAECAALGLTSPAQSSEEKAVPVTLLSPVMALVGEHCDARWPFRVDAVRASVEKGACRWFLLLGVWAEGGSKTVQC